MSQIVIKMVPQKVESVPNPDAFQFDMSGAPWSVVEVFDDVDDKLHAFDRLFNEILDDHAPI